MFLVHQPIFSTFPNSVLGIFWRRRIGLLGYLTLTYMKIYLFMQGDLTNDVTLALHEIKFSRL